MIHGMIAWSLRSRFLVIVLAVALMVFGIIQIRHMPVDALEPIRITPLAKQEPLYLGGDKVQTATYRAIWNRSELFG